MLIMYSITAAGMLPAILSSHTRRSDGTVVDDPCCLAWQSYDMLRDNRRQITYATGVDERVGMATCVACCSYAEVARAWPHQTSHTVNACCDALNAGTQGNTCANFFKCGTAMLNLQHTICQLPLAMFCIRLQCDAAANVVFRQL